MCNEIPEVVRLVVPSLTTVFVGGVLVQRFFVRRANQAIFVDYMFKELGELRNDALEYWTQTVSDETRDKIKQMEAKIKGRVHSLVSDLNFFRKIQKSRYMRLLFWIFDRLLKCCQKAQPGKQGPGYLTAMLEVHAACTDGDFETEQHRADSSKYFPICSTISAVKSELLRIKL